MSTDRIGEGRGRMATTLGAQIEGRLLGFEEEMLQFEEDHLRKKKSIWKSEEVNFRQNEEFLRKKQKVLREREGFRAKKEKFYRQKDRRLEESRSKLQEQCLKLELGLGNRIWRSEEPGEELLPGIPNEITLNKITTKLSQREFRILSSVCRGWYNAIRNHQVYDARVGSHSTETFVVVWYYNRNVGTLVLRSLRDNYCFELPPISHLGGGVPQSSRYVAVDGKIYVLGGVFGGPSDKVYMLDLAGQRPWTLCASMQQARYNFGCNVMDGKIYVFGGTGFKRRFCDSEVYDTKENTWSPITPMPFSQYGLQVAVVGKELVLHGHTDDDPAFFLAIYHPVQDEWMKPKPCPLAVLPIYFGVHGKLYSISRRGIHVHDFDDNSWTKLYSHSFTAVYPSEESVINFNPFSISAVDGELVASGYLSNPDRSIYTSCVLRSIGFSSNRKEIQWREERGWLGVQMIHFMFSIQL